MYIFDTKVEQSRRYCPWNFIKWTEKVNQTCRQTHGNKDRQRDRVRRVRLNLQPSVHQLNKLPTSLNIYPVPRTTDILHVPVFWHWVSLSGKLCTDEWGYQIQIWPLVTLRFCLSFYFSFNVFFPPSSWDRCVKGRCHPKEMLDGIRLNLASLCCEMYF